MFFLCLDLQVEILTYNNLAEQIILYTFAMIINDSITI